MRRVLAAPPIDADRLKARALDFAPAGVAARYLKILLPEALQ